MPNEWLYVGLFLLVGAAVPTAAIAVSWIIAPRKPNAIKQSTYECGMETVGENWIQFKAQYYVFALVFLVFDVETVFLFPWAVALGRVPVFAAVEGIVFIMILIAGLVYGWRKGALEWG
jgi:NADH:ubiquinone oxidoreductase subunit 3 (subunit A)